MAKRPPTPRKFKHSIARAPASNKFNLTPVQKIQVDIIDWKRNAVRCFLVIAYFALGHCFVYLVMLGRRHSLIHASIWFMGAFYGFFLDLGMYFFGSGVALKAISHVWSPAKFLTGLISIFLGVLLNIALYFVGTVTSEDYDQGFPMRLISLCEESNHVMLDDIQLRVCKSKDVVTNAIAFMPKVMPAVVLVCLGIAAFSAYKAIYVAPKRLLPDVLVDAIWLEPYETYDFYVGRYIHKSSGYDEDVDDGQRGTSTYFAGMAAAAAAAASQGDTTDTESLGFGNTKGHHHPNPNHKTHG